MRCRPSSLSRTSTSVAEACQRRRPVLRWLAAAVVLAAAGHAVVLTGAELKRETQSAWGRYMQATESRIAREMADESRFFSMVGEGSSSASTLLALQHGRVIVREVTAFDERGMAIPVPNATVNHWRGAVFVKGITLEQALGSAAGIPDQKQDDLGKFRIIARDGDTLTIFMRLQKRAIVTVTYNSEHEVRTERIGEGAAFRSSHTTRMAEVVDADTPAERELPEGQGRGFLWNMNSFWRFKAMNGGVLVECESLTLSRAIPFAIRFIVNPIVDRMARKAMSDLLTSYRDRFKGIAPQETR
jgi:hypothetical protein